MNIKQVYLMVLNTHAICVNKETGDRFDCTVKGLHDQVYAHLNSWLFLKSKIKIKESEFIWIQLGRKVFACT